MRFGKKFEDYKDIKERTFFAWLPITLNGETRWLEKVRVKGYYFVGHLTGKVIFFDSYFID